MFYMFFADGFEEVEAIAALDVIRRAGIKAESVGIGSREITGAHGITVICDKSETDIKPSAELEGVILPGGMPGTTNLLASDCVNCFIDYCAQNSLYLCAICAAPVILGRKGLLCRSDWGTYCRAGGSQYGCCPSKARLSRGASKDYRRLWNGSYFR